MKKIKDWRSLFALKNVIRCVIAHLNVNSIKNKVEVLSEGVTESVKVQLRYLRLRQFFSNQLVCHKWFLKTKHDGTASRGGILGTIIPGGVIETVCISWLFAIIKSYCKVNSETKK